MPLFAILTLFPEAIEAYATTSILGLAQEKKLVSVLPVDFRDFARDRHRTVDDRPFGGGPGMVLKPDPIVRCVEWLEEIHGPFRKFAMCPTGRVFDRASAHEMSASLQRRDTETEDRFLFLCGRYEGFDARLDDCLELEKISLGNFVLSGGELPALAVCEAVMRLLPGALGDERSAPEDSFEGDGGLDHPQYTRPRVFRGLPVPDVLLSGDHGRIERWRKERATDVTRKRRPDLTLRDESPR